MRRPPLVNKNLPGFNPGFHTHSGEPVCDWARCKMNLGSKSGAVFYFTSSKLKPTIAVAGTFGFAQHHLVKTTFTPS
jgi:hypothetical protein